MRDRPALRLKVRRASFIVLCLSGGLLIGNWNGGMVYGIGLGYLAFWWWHRV